MNLHILRGLALSLALTIAACGGGSSRSVSNASASGVRFGQKMTVTFAGLGLDGSVDARIDGPCTGLAREAGGTATTIQFSCLLDGTGRVTASLFDTSDQVVLGSIAVQVPLPRYSMTVTDGTRSGTIVIELDPAAAPRTVAQWTGYVSDGFYTGTLFHRVRPDTAILGGGYTTPGDGVVSAKLTTRADLALERTGLLNLRGAVAMYREAGLNSANSMFFINTVDNPRFDAGSIETPDGYAVFGKVVSGIEVVDEIAKVPVRPDLSLGVVDVPVTAVRISALAQTR